jgi:hypothetical protein
MKIIIDRLDGPPPHALTREDLLAIVRAVPPQWWIPRTFHLKATLPEHCAFKRPVVFTAFRMNIYSRGLTPEDARKEILRQLATPFGNRRPFGAVSKADLEGIDRAVEPILERVAQALAGRIELPQRDENRTFRASNALQAAGYSWDEAYKIIRALEREAEHPTSGRLPGWVQQGQKALREAGIDPETLSELS